MYVLLSLVAMTPAAPTFSGSESAVPLSAEAISAEALLAAPAPYGAPLPATVLATMPHDETEAPTGFFEDWSGNVLLGASLAEGNSESLNADLTFLAIREFKDGEDVKARWTLNGFYHFAEGQFEVTPGVFETRDTRKISGIGAQYDRYLSEATYAYGNASVLHDSIGDVDARVIIGIGIGHVFVNEDDFRYAGEAGFSYVDEDLQGRGDTPLIDPDNEYVAGRLAHVLDWKIFKDVALHHDAEVFPSLEDSDDFYGRANSSLSWAFSENLSLAFAWLLLYDNTPVSGNDRVDNVFSVNVGWLL